MKLWSWQCHGCYGTHEYIYFRDEKPTSALIKCPFCDDRMKPYELGKGFLVKPKDSLVCLQKAA